MCAVLHLVKSQSPQTGQFNSYIRFEVWVPSEQKSQAPQTGQFNSY